MLKRQQCVYGIPQAAHLGDHLGRLAKVSASLHRVGLGKVVFNEPEADVVAHLIELLVDLDIVAIKVLAQLGHDCAVGQGHELGVDLVDPRPSRMLDTSATCSLPACAWLGLSYFQILPGLVSNGSWPKLGGMGVDRLFAHTGCLCGRHLQSRARLSCHHGSLKRAAPSLDNASAQR